MGYIGRGPVKSGAFRIIDDVSSGFDGSDVTFTLQHNSSNITPGTEQNLLIAVDGVVQEPQSAFTISGSVLTFTSAPASGASFWGVELGDVGGIAQTIANGTVDSSQIVNGSIDTAHIGNLQITNALMADDAVNSDELAAGAVDLAHMSSQSVDEDNLYVSNTGNNGEFLSKQSGNPGGLTWAAAGGGTKEFFIPVTFGTGGITMIGDRPHTVLAQTQVAGMAFFVPHDYSSITNAVIVCRRGSADTNLDWDIFSDYAAIGQSYTSHSEADTSTTYISSGIDNQLHEVNVAGILTSLAAGDHVGIRILNNEASSGGLHVLGLRFKYA